MFPQPQPEAVMDDDAEPVREERVQALTHTGPRCPASGASFFHHFRSLFVAPESHPNSVTLEYKNWQNADIQCRALAIPTPPSCELSEERPVMAEPLQDGRLVLHAIIPRDYPGGKEAFSATSARFLRNEHVFGITHIYHGEEAIAAYLKMVSESFKEQSKSSSRNKNKDPKGKAIKWKNPATAFGCRYVWAHDLANPHLLYFRVRPSWVDLPALAVVDTTHDEYQNGLGNNKENFVQCAIPQIHLNIILKNYKRFFQKSSQEQPEVPGVQSDPTQAWWWNIVQENQRRRHMAQLAAAPAPAPAPMTEPTNAEAVTEGVGSAGDSSETLVPSDEPDDYVSGQEVSQTAPLQEAVPISADEPLPTETIEDAEEHKDDKGKKPEITTESSDLAHGEDVGENVDVQSSQRTKETLTKGEEPETGSSKLKALDSEKPIETVETHGSSSSTSIQTLEPLLESEDQSGSNEANTSEKPTTKRNSTQITATAEASSIAGSSAVGKIPDSGTGQKTSKSKKKKCKKNRKSKKPDQKMMEDDDESWNVVTHGKKRQGLTKSKTHDSFSQHIEQTSSNMRGVKKPAQRLSALAPPPQMTDAEFPRLPAVPENIPVHHMTVPNPALVSGNASGTSHANKKNEQTVSSHSTTVATSASTGTSVQPLAPPFRPRVYPRVQPGPKAFIQLDSTGFACAMPDCDKRCCSLDYTSVICPRCGPLSDIRYCGLKHLFDDVKHHWQWCGQFTFLAPARGNLPVVQSPPLMPTFYMWDNPERFRLALRHAVDRTGDYFVFSDWVDYMRHGQPADILDIRCSTQVTHKVSFSDPVMKDRFRRVLGICLLLSPLQLEFINYFFRMVRDNLREQGVWNDNVSEAVLYQMTLEFGVDLQDWFTGTRHACEVEWIGGNRRRGCKDATCLAEHANRYGSVATLLEQKTRDIEANFWILRAHRFTHPDIPGMSQEAVQRRTRGEGFEGVFPDDQRLFARGPGWDYETAELEIEDYGV